MGQAVRQDWKMNNFSDKSSIRIITDFLADLICSRQTVLKGGMKTFLLLLATPKDTPGLCLEVTPSNAWGILGAGD